MLSKYKPFSLRDASFFSYLYKKMQKENRNYVNTNYGYIMNMVGYKSIPAARYLVKKLEKRKLITVQVGINWKGLQYLRIRIAKPRVIKKLLDEYSSQKSTDGEELSLKNSNPEKQNNTGLLNNNINIINQINHSGKNSEKKKTTIVQDMIQVYNEVVNGSLSADKKLAPWLVAAFKQKFHTLERWRQYLKHKVWGKIKDTFRFLVNILKYPIINAAMGEMGMTAELPPQYTQEAAYNHVDTLRETSACLHVRREMIDRKGAVVYFTWFTKVALHEEDGCIVAQGNNSFISDYINTQYRVELERYYDDWRLHGENQPPKKEGDEASMIADISVTGRVGFVDVKDTATGKVVKLALSHDQSQKKDGKWDSETVWYRVIYNCGRESLRDIQKGDVVRALGTLTILHGNKKDGTPYTTFTVMAKDVKRLFKKEEKKNEGVGNVAYAT